MHSKLALVCIVMAFVAHEAAGQGSLRCYSCSSNLGNSFGRRNYECVNNLTNVRTVSCRRGSYCLTSFTVQAGVITSLRRNCQNPSYDHNDNTDTAPNEDGCISTHSRYSSSSDSSTCYIHCTTSRCNKDTPFSIKKCPDECPNNCDLTTGTCSSALSCVQCTSDNDPKCNEKTDATPCPGSSYNYCAATRTTVLDLRNNAVNTAVTKTCTRFRNTYDIPSAPCTFRTSSRSSTNSELVRYGCSSFCSTNGCNQKIPGGTSGKISSSSLSCVVCSQVGSRGNCASSTRTTRCPAGSNFCKATVTYYASIEEGSNNPNYQLASINRECATAAVTTQCTSSTVRGSNLEYVSCQETCQTNGCNTGWPARPKCSSCSGTNRTYSSFSFERCRTNPPPPRQCSSPLFQYCTTISNNTASHPNQRPRVSRGCSITDIGTRCYDIPTFGGDTINHCQTSCKTTGCNEERGRRRPKSEAGIENSIHSLFEFHEIGGILGGGENHGVGGLFGMYGSGGSGTASN